MVKKHVNAIAPQIERLDLFRLLQVSQERSAGVANLAVFTWMKFSVPNLGESVGGRCCLDPPISSKSPRPRTSMSHTFCIT